MANICQGHTPLVDNPVGELLVGRQVMHKMKELTALATTIAEVEVTDVTKTDRTQNSIYLHKQRFLLFYFLLICSNNKRATIEIGKGKLPKIK